VKKDLVLFKEGEKFNKIISKAGDVNAVDFKTIDEKKLTEISEWMPEVNRAVSAFNKQNSQTTMSLMTLNMIDSGPYRVLRQILAQVEKKRAALKENLYKLQLKKIEYRELEAKLKEDLLNDLQKEKISLEKNKIGSDIIDSQGHIEAAVKELGSLKRHYEEICKNKNIPENWDEEDFEEAEIEHHIKSIFRNAIRDRMQGGHNQGTMEYMEQFGINPISAYAMVDNYIHSIRQALNDPNKVPDIQSHYKFYNKMHQIFKNEYKKAMKNLGLDSIIQADFLMKEHSHG